MSEEPRNEYVDKPLKSGHVCELMTKINELEDDWHWYQDSAQVFSLLSSARLVGVYNHPHRGNLFYFASPYGKQVWVCKADGEVVYTWNVPVLDSYSGFTLHEAVYLDDRTGPHWSRGICVDHRGYVYVAMYLRFRKGYIDGGRTWYDWKHLFTVYQFSEAGIRIQDFRFGLFEHSTQGEQPYTKDLWRYDTQYRMNRLAYEPDWKSNAGAVAVYGDNLVYARDRFQYFVPTNPPEYEGSNRLHVPVPVPCAMFVRHTITAYMLSQWHNSEWEFGSNPSDNYNALWMRANQYGIWCIPFTWEVLLGEVPLWYKYCSVSIRPGFIGREWSGQEIIKSNGLKPPDLPEPGKPIKTTTGTCLNYPGPLAIQTMHKDFEVPEGYRIWTYGLSSLGDTVKQVGERGFSISESVLFTPLYMATVSRDQYQRLTTAVSWTAPICSEVKLEELTEEEIEQGKVPDILVTPTKRETLTPFWRSWTLGEALYTPAENQPLRVLKFLRYPMTEWFGYKVEPSRIQQSIGVKPDKDALADMKAQTVDRTIFDMRDALERLVALEAHFYSFDQGIKFAFGEQTDWQTVVSILMYANMMTEHDYGLRTPFWNGWGWRFSPLAFAYKYIYDVDIGQIEQVVSLLNRTMFTDKNPGLWRARAIVANLTKLPS